MNFQDIWVTRNWKFKLSWFHGDEFCCFPLQASHTGGRCGVFFPGLSLHCPAVLLPLATYSQASSWFCEHMRAEAFPMFLCSQHLPLPCFPGGSDSKESACNVGKLGQEDPLEKGMGTHSSILAWRIPWIEEPGRVQSLGSQRVRYDWVINTNTYPSSRCIGGA